MRGPGKRATCARSQCAARTRVGARLMPRKAPELRRRLSRLARPSSTMRPRAFIAYTRVRAATTTCASCMRAYARTRVRAPFCRSPAAWHTSPTLRASTRITRARCQALERAVYSRADTSPCTLAPPSRRNAGAIASLPVPPSRGAALRARGTHLASSCSPQSHRARATHSGSMWLGTTPHGEGRHPWSSRRRVPALRPSPQTRIRLAARAGPRHTCVFVGVDARDLAGANARRRQRASAGAHGRHVLMGWGRRRRCARDVM